METDSLRLNKYLALQLGISRREADELIAAGQVKINDTLAQLGARFQPSDKIAVKGKMIKENAQYTYLLFNKPVGYVCSRRAQGENPTIYELIPKEYHHLKPVGRLDKDSSGLLLLSNDGDFAFRMTHPKFRKTKVYEVQFDRALEPLHQQMISDYGIQLEDGTSKFIVQRLENKKDTYEVTMSEGRNRQIRRTFAALGYEVIKLHRTQFGNYSLGDIKPREYKITKIH